MMLGYLSPRAMAGARRFNEANGRLPSEADLADWCVGHVMKYHPDAVVSDYEQATGADRAGWGRVTDSVLQRTADRAAHFAILNFDPTYTERMHTRARKGGQNSHRPPVYTVEMLRALPEEVRSGKHSTAAIVALWGCTRQTVNKVKREDARLREIGQ